MHIEEQYLKLPIPLQHVACSLEGWHIQRSRFGEPFPALLREIESRTYWPPERIRDYRDARLRAFVRHAANTVPYYRRRFRELGISPDDIHTLEDLSRLPLLTKGEIQGHYAEIVSEAVPKRERMPIHTGGTTGGGLQFASTRRALQEQWAFWWRCWHWHGIPQGTWCGFFGGRLVVPSEQKRPPFWRYNLPARQILFSAYHTSPEHLDAYVAELRRRRPPWLHGYPSVLAVLAAHMVDMGIDLGYQVRWITLGAENVYPQQVKLMERAFGVRPRQHYGMAEAVANISECELGGLHVDEDFAAVEFIPNPDGPAHRIVGTNLTNPATPMLRYDVLDLATPADHSCPCGRPGRLVAALDGRLNDYIVLKNGARVGCLGYILKDMLNAREVQIYQRRPGEITLHVVRGDAYTEQDEALLLRDARQLVGDDTEISVEYVETLPRARNGKLRVVVSDLPQELLQDAERWND